MGFCRDIATLYFKWNLPYTYNWVLGPPCTNLQELEIQAQCHFNVKERSIRPGFVQMNLALFYRNRKNVLTSYWLISVNLILKEIQYVHSGFIFPKEIIKEHKKKHIIALNVTA